MENKIRIFAIIGVVLYFIYIIAGSLSGFLVGSLQMSANNSMSAMFIDNVVYAIMIFAGSKFMFLVVYIVMMILLIAASKSDNNNIVLEIVCIVILNCSFIGSLLVMLINMLVQSTYGMDVIAAFSAFNSGTALVGLLATLGRTFMMMSAIYSICKKKYVFPLEVIRNGETFD